MITVSFLLIIVTALGLASCSCKRSIVHEIHYVPSYGATAPERPVDKPDRRSGPAQPRNKHDDTNAASQYKNKRQYPRRGMSRGDSD